MFSDSFKMIKKDRNMSELWQILCKRFKFKIVDFVEFILSIVHWLVSVPSAPRIIFDLRDSETRKIHSFSWSLCMSCLIMLLAKCPFQFNIIHSVNYSYNQSHSPKIHTIELKTVHTFWIIPTPCWWHLGAKNCGSWCMRSCGILLSVFFMNSNSLIQINFPQISNLHIPNTATRVRAV